MSPRRQFDVGEVFKLGRPSLWWSPVVCMLLCIGVQEDSSYRFDRGFTSEVASSEASVYV